MIDVLERLARMMADHERGGYKVSYTIIGDSENGYDIITHILNEVEDD